MWYVIIGAKEETADLTPEDEAAQLAAIRANLFSGSRPAPRGERHRHRPQQEPIDPAELGPYELLLAEQLPYFNRAALFSLSLDWSTLFTLEETRAWLAAGARGHDLETVRRLHEAGVTPDKAGREVLRVGRPTGQTFLQMVRRGSMTPQQVYEITSRPPGRSAKGGG